MYILECRDGRLYTGTTTDVGRRFREHQAASGRAARFTRANPPERVVYRQRVRSRGAALRREAAVRRLGRAGKLKLCRRGAFR